MEKQLFEFEGRTFYLSVRFDGYGWVAIEENYDGPEDHIRIASSLKSEQDAIDSLKENIQEAILEGRF